MNCNPGQKSLGHLTKCQLVTHYFEVGSHYLICRNPHPPKNIVGIVGLLRMNQHQHCVGGGEAEVDIHYYVGKSTASQDFDQDCSYMQV